MDAFFASVEALDDPMLRGRPLIVGGTGRRGVVASCSYEARVYGVRSAMPTGQARRLCPQAVFVPGRYQRYAEVSQQMHAIFHRYTPEVEGISLDEAFLDVTRAIRLFGAPEVIGTGIRQSVSDELGLSCSVGGSTVKFLAKLASEAAKPRIDGSHSRPGAGVLILDPGRELEFLHPHPIEALWGVGPATAKRLRQLGMATIGDLGRVDPAVVEGAVGRAAGAHLARLARGIDERRVEPHREVKSISHEETYPLDRRDPDGLRVEVLRLADSVGSRLRRAGVVGRTVTLKLRHGDFTTHTRSVTSPLGLDDGREIGQLAATLLAAEDLSDGIRLLGVGVSNLCPAGSGPGEQLALDLRHPPAGLGGRSTGSASRDPPGRGPQGRTGSTTAAVDAIRARFGPDAVGAAALLGAQRLRIKRPGDSQWGPNEPEANLPEADAPEADAPDDIGTEPFDA
jgi:DNA polymerase-4